MRTSTAIASALAALVWGPLAAHAQTDQLTPFHHYHVHHFQGPHHTVRHRVAPISPVPAPAPAAGTAAPQTAPFGLAWPRIAPYPDNKGDEDGLSEDTNDCNKGCIDGAPD